MELGTYTNHGFEPDATHGSGVASSDIGHTRHASKENNSPVSDGQSKHDSVAVDFALANTQTSKRSMSLKGKGGHDEKLKEKDERRRSFTDGEPYRGMGKEELLRFSNRPFWRNLRYICMSVVLTGWLALLITVVAIVLTYPHCRAPKPRDWWQKAVIYRIYVPSFFDTDCNGIGDLKGVQKKLDYLHDLGVTTISLSPIYRLGKGYGPSDTHIVNHTDVDPVYGSLDDLAKLVNQTHQRGMYVTLDFIPNHTSDEHPWFQWSSNNGSDSRENIYRSYYVWAHGLTTNQTMPPNNWQSVYNCPAWEQGDDKEWYLHQLLPTQPELNLRSQKVKDELQSILKFWLDIGVDGFYIRDSKYLFEDYDLRDEELIVENFTNLTCAGVDTAPYDAYNHSRTQHLPEVFDMLARWRAYLDVYGNQTGSYKILMADTDGSYDNIMDYYGRFNRDGVDFPLNTFSLNLDSGAGGDTIRNLVDTWRRNITKGRWANWMGGDDRSTRLADRVGSNLTKPYLMLSMLLPGTPYYYYGDEIGLGGSNITNPSTNIETTTSMAHDFNNEYREMSMRGPMSWTNATKAGFTNGCRTDPWMSLSGGYASGINVEQQMKNPESLWHLFRNLTSLRQGKPSFEYGDYTPLIQDDEIFSFVREYDGEKGYLVALNFSPQPISKQLNGFHDTLPESADVEVVCGENAIHIQGGSANLDPLKLMPYEGIVVSWDYQAKDV